MVNDIVKAILDNYKNSEVCLSEFLDGFKINNATVGDIFRAYAIAMHQVEGDDFIRRNKAEGWSENIVTGETI